MPRKFDETQKKKWLELYEGGKTEKRIARDAGCDVRTVRKAINEARLKRDVVVARIELVKDALRKHQDSLLEELDQIMSSLVIPQKDLAVLSWHRGGDSVFTQSDDNTIREIGSLIPSRPQGSGESAMRRLLKEHLKHDRLWRVLAQWEKANASHMTARTELQRRVTFLLQEKTGYDLVDNDSTPPVVFSYTAGPLLYKIVTDLAYVAPEGSIDLEKAIRSLEMDISANTDSGDVRFRDSSILAVAPGSEQRTKQNLLDAFKALAESTEVESVVETYKALEQITIIARQVVEETRLLGLIPGQCEVCRRLGI